MSGNEPKARTECMAMVTRSRQGNTWWWSVQVDTHVVPKAYYGEHPETVGTSEVIRWAIQDDSLEERYDIRARIRHSMVNDDNRTVYLLRTHDHANA
jgi:hypothetical protein